MRDSRFTPPLPTPPKLQGVAVQKLLTLAELVFVFGSYRTNRQVLHVDMMGTHLSYRRTPHDFIIDHTEETITLSGDAWTVDLRHISLSRGRENNALYPKTRLVLWGRERLKMLTGVEFMGDTDAFKRDLLYAQMLGDEYAAWEEMLRYREHAE